MRWIQRVMIRPAMISTGVTANHVSIEIRENSRGVLGDEAQDQERHPGASPADQRADGLAMHRHAAPTAVHVAHFGQQTVDDDRHGGGDDVVVDRGRQAAADRNGESSHDAGCVGKAIPHPPRRPLLINMPMILHDHFPLNLLNYRSPVGRPNATGRCILLPTHSGRMNRRSDTLVPMLSEGRGQDVETWRFPRRVCGSHSGGSYSCWGRAGRFRAAGEVGFSTTIGAFTCDSEPRFSFLALWGFF